MISLVYETKAIRDKKDDLVGAIEYIEKAIEISPGVSQFHTNAASFRFKAKDYDETVVQAEKAVELDQLNHSAYELLALSYCELDDTENFLYYAIQAINLKLEFFRTYGERAKSREAEGNLKGAKEDFKQAEKLDTEIKNITAYIMLTNVTAISYNGNTLEINPSI